MLSSRASSRGAALASRRAAAGIASTRAANASQHARALSRVARSIVFGPARSTAVPLALAPLTLGAHPALAVGLRRVPAVPAFAFSRTYATAPHTSTTSTTTTSAPPPPSSASSSAPLSSVNEKTDPSVVVPPPGTPPPSAPPAATEVATAPEDEKKVAKEEKKPTGPWHKRAWATVKKEAAHYWAGTKLLGQEIKVSTKLQYKVLQGGVLTRRERRQLRRTTTDLLRLLPFSIFILIPFMEFLLPVALKLFPNMLPSTFEGQLAKDEKERKLLRVRLEMAKFLQETVQSNGLKEADNVVHSDEFKEFFRKVRATGEKPSQSDVIRVAKLFNNDITLDNLSRPQLVSMCRYMNINAYGTDNFLKHQIRSRLEKIRVDDMMIHAEGVDSLSTSELRQACQSRGIRVTGQSPAHLREEMEQWIELHYTNGISGVLLILSRAFNFENKSDDVMASLITTLSSLPENLISEAELAVSPDSDFKQKLEVLQQQQELIEDEAEQEQEELDARKAKKEAEEAAKEAAKREKEEVLRQEALKAKASAEALAAAAAAVGAVPGAAPVTAAGEPGHAHPAGTLETKVEEKPAEEVKPEPEEDDAKMTKEQLSELAEALSILTAKSSIEKERDELEALFADNLLSEAESKQNPDEADSKSVAVSKRVRSMIKKIDAQLEKYEQRVGESLNLIHTNAKDQISLHDLKKALTMIKHAPPPEIVDSLGKKLDVDQDGFVDLEHVIELTQDDGLGILLDDEAHNLVSSGADIRHSKDLKELKPKREDIIAE